MFHLNVGVSSHATVLRRKPSVLELHLAATIQLAIYQVLSKGDMFDLSPAPCSVMSTGVEPSLLPSFLQRPGSASSSEHRDFRVSSSSFLLQPARRLTIVDSSILAGWILG